jgi:hypothetical protein
VKTGYYYKRFENKDGSYQVEEVESVYLGNSLFSWVMALVLKGIIFLFVVEDAKVFKIKEV